jgi:hypothetical protein
VPEFRGGGLCAPCPAGTFSPGGAAAACLPCPAGAIAAKSGAAACSECGPGLVPSSNTSRTACVPCLPSAPSPPAGPQKRRGRGGAGPAGGPAGPLEPAACAETQCPPGFLPDSLGLCISSDPGSARLCAGGGAPAAPQLDAREGCGQAQRPIRQGGPPSLGGAVLKLQGSLVNSTGRACATGVQQLAGWLADVPTWAGLRYSMDGSPDDSGVFWQVGGA